MSKKFILAVIAVFVAWSAMDFVIHGVLLQKIYEATASMWRPMEEMKMGLGYAVTLIVATAFVAIYAGLAKNRSAASGLKFGLLYGIAAGVPMGFGSYCWMPIPLSLAWGWTLGMLVKSLVGGLIAGAILKSAPEN